MTARRDDFDIAGVTLPAAMAWLRGEMFASKAADLDTSRCEVAFLNEIGNLASYPAACRATLQLWDNGARAIIAHVTSPVFLKKYRRHGALITRQEPIIWRGEPLLATRLIVPVAGFRQWVEKMKVNTADAKSKPL